MQYEYYKRYLSLDEKKIYETIQYAVQKYETKISMAITKDQIHRAVSFLVLDHPEFFYWKTYEIKEKKSILTGDIYIEVILVYYYGSKDYKEKIDDIKSKAEQKADSILNKIDSDIENEPLFINQLFDSYLRSLKIVKEETNDEKRRLRTNTIIGSLGRYKETSQQGLSRCIKYLLDRANINCIIIQGISNSTGKVMYYGNIVWINDKPIHVNGYAAIKYNENLLCEDDIYFHYDMKPLLGGLIPKCDDKRTSILSDEIYIKKDISSQCSEVRVDESEGRKSPIIFSEDIPIKTNENKYVGNSTVVHSDEELRTLLQNNAKLIPFDFAAKLEYKCELEQTGINASKYIIRYHLIHGEKIQIDFEIFRKESILHFISM